MKRVHLLLLLMGLTLNISGADAQTRDGVESGAMLCMPTAEHDFGTVKRKGGDLKYCVEVKNCGDSPLVLTRVVTSCSCLKAQFSKKPIPVGETHRIELTYQPGKVEAGTFYKVVQIMSNSKGGRAIFTIRGNSVE